jgi:N-acetylneuraminate synthase
LGSSIIEKHFTLNRDGGGPDDSFSLEPNELTDLCLGVKTSWQALGKIDYGLKSSEQGSVKFRRSLYFTKSLKAGDVITENAIRSVRPGYGVAPKYFNDFIGKKVVVDIEKNTPVTWGTVSDS